MNLLLTIFFVSLLGLIILIGRKVVFLRTGGSVDNGELLFNLPSLAELKEISIKLSKRAGYNFLVIVIKLYVKLSYLFKTTHGKVKTRMQSLTEKYTPERDSAPKQVSKFLKAVGDYKQRIRRIKRKIKEEEGLE